MTLSDYRPKVAAAGLGAPTAFALVVEEPQSDVQR